MRPEEVQNTWQEGGHLMREAEERSKAKMSRAHGQQPESQNEPSVRAADDGIIDSEFLRWIRQFSRPELEILVFRLQKQLKARDQTIEVTSNTLFTLVYALTDLTNGHGRVSALLLEHIVAHALDCSDVTACYLTMYTTYAYLGSCNLTCTAIISALLSYVDIAINGSANNMGGRPNTSSDDMFDGGGTESAMVELVERAGAARTANAHNSPARRARSELGPAAQGRMPQIATLATAHVQHSALHDARKLSWTPAAQALCFGGAIKSLRETGGCGNSGKVSKTKFEGRVQNMIGEEWGPPPGQVLAVVECRSSKQGRAHLVAQDEMEKAHQPDPVEPSPPLPVRASSTQGLTFVNVDKDEKELPRMIVGSEASVRIRLPRVIMKATASTGIAPDIVYLGYGVPAASYSSVANTDTVFIPKGLGFASPPSCDASIHAPFTPAGVHRLAIVRIREVLPAMIVSLA
ncbi:hypothetical protein FOMPIDRAFT_1020281 [Fomitopsis schrenkii]|uniref:Uncharacterized protein n=1 Tax=Fomitopsis schrenkii TaxID=2126942 RepID=S8F504_FOMSC|nr:hypothetical protein FOMPIDRAFT_1020281 [Fomitopsis schrenkii]